MSITEYGDDGLKNMPIVSFLREFYQEFKFCNEDDAKDVTLKHWKWSLTWY